MAKIVMALLAAACAVAWAGARADAGDEHSTKLFDPPMADRVQLAEAVPMPVAKPGGPAGRVDWNGDNFFGPCQGDCSLALFGGREIQTSMRRVFLVKYPPAPAWEWHWRNSEVVGLVFSRRLVTFWHALSIEPEFGVAKRFGEMHAGEAWGALVFRWSRFPWNDYLRTTIALSEGLSVTTRVDARERELNGPLHVKPGVKRSGSVLLNYFSPEITFSLPKYAAYELFFRWHHRSGIFNAINNVDAAAQFGTIGLRMHF